MTGSNEEEITDVKGLIVYFKYKNVKEIKEKERKETKENERWVRLIKNNEETGKDGKL